MHGVWVDVGGCAMSEAQPGHFGDPVGQGQRNGICALLDCKALACTAVLFGLTTRRIRHCTLACSIPGSCTSQVGGHGVFLCVGGQHVSLQPWFSHPSYQDDRDYTPKAT